MGNVLRAAPGASNVQQAQQLAGETITIEAGTMGGTRCEVTANSRDSVGQLKGRLELALGIPPAQQKLVVGGQALRDNWVLCEHGVTSGSQVTVVVGRPEPEWARCLGLTGEHPCLLRDYCEAHGLEAPEWLADEESSWEALRKEKEKREENRRNLTGWSHFIFLQLDGAPAGTLRVGPGEQVSCSAHGWIHNNHGDTCIHQLVLALDTQIIADLSDGVPGRGRNITKRISFKAPDDPGTYMLWRYNDLQYSMRDAKVNFQGRHGDRVKAELYPGCFVGWLVVE
mmetsp:Transcript_113017/g.364928  ORF Transcript_113017/g.364928 Transcript_113017/m.364928 type:complete len:284 (+) Transcript_113017:80-931(+)